MEFLTFCKDLSQKKTISVFLEAKCRDEKVLEKSLKVWKIRNFVLFLCSPTLYCINIEEMFIYLRSCDCFSGETWLEENQIKAISSAKWFPTEI